MDKQRGTRASPPAFLSPLTITNCQDGVFLQAAKGIPEVDLPHLWSTTMPIPSAPWELKSQTAHIIG